MIMALHKKGQERDGRRTGEGWEMRAGRTDQCAGVAGPRRASVVGLRAAPYTMDDTNKVHALN